jgi:hypothetical protein
VNFDFEAMNRDHLIARVTDLCVPELDPCNIYGTATDYEEYAAACDLATGTGWPAPIIRNTQQHVIWQRAPDGQLTWHSVVRKGIFTTFVIIWSQWKTRIILCGCKRIPNTGTNIHSVLMPFLTCMPMKSQPSKNARQMKSISMRHWLILVRYTGLQWSSRKLQPSPAPEQLLRAQAL